MISIQVLRVERSTVTCSNLELSRKPKRTDTSHLDERNLIIFCENGIVNFIDINTRTKSA